MDRKEIAAVLEEIGVLLDLKGENPFKVRAYQNAARILESQALDLESLVRDGNLNSIKGIGEALAEKIAALVKTGSLPYYEELRAGIPPGLLDMLKVPGLGPRKVKALYEKLGISTLGELEYACQENRLLELDGFGAKTQDNILNGVRHIKKFQGRFLYGEMIDLAQELLELVLNSQGVVKAELGGSIRRRLETVKDIDIVAAVKGDPGPLMDAFTGNSLVETVVAHGPTKSSVTLVKGINSDLRAVAPDEFPYALHHFTGSKDHNVAMRGRAEARFGIKINEYGLFKKTKTGEKKIPAKDEKEFFKALGLEFIEPELRENTGEIEAAEAGELPEMVKFEDTAGCFHIHTNRSDGVEPLEIMARAAAGLGLKYIGISDHSQSAFYANGLKPTALLEQKTEIQKLNKKLKGKIHIFHGVESDILPDGSLDYGDEILKDLDFVIASVHSNFKMNRDEMTNRIVKALKNSFTTFLGHPTGRLLLGRDSYQVDMSRVIEAAAENGVCLEINAHPQRLDVDWRYLKTCKQKGVLIAVNPDAHRVEGLDDIRFGIGIARKGWLEARDVLTTWPVEKVKSWLEKRKGKQ